MSSWISQPIKPKNRVPSNEYYCKIGSNGFGSNFLNFFMCYLFTVKGKNKNLFLSDTTNNISNNFHLITDTFKTLPKINLTIFNGITIQQNQLQYLRQWFEKTMTFEDLKSEAKKIFQLNDKFLNNIKLLKNQMPIDFDLGVHIRSGDKITTNEMKEISLEKYIEAIKIYEETKTEKEKINIYIMTDNINVIKKLQEKEKEKENSKWKLYFIESPIKYTNSMGHIQKEFNNSSESDKMKAYIHFLTELSILQECPMILCTFSSNIGRYLYLTQKDGGKIESLDDKSFNLFGGYESPNTKKA